MNEIRKSGGGSVLANVDGISLLLYIVLVIIGWFSIYSSEYTGEGQGLIDFGMSHGKQIMNIGIGFILAMIIMLLDSRIFHTISYVAFALTLGLLLVTLFIGKTVSGAKGWIDLGPMMLQTAEFAKIGAAMALAKMLSTHGFDMRDQKQRYLAMGIIGLPCLMVLLQNDTGSALVFLSLFFVLFRQGLSGWFILIPVWVGMLTIMVLIFGKFPVLITLAAVLLIMFVFYFRFFKRALLIIVGAAILSAGIVFAVDTLLGMLKPYQRERIEVVVGTREDPKGVGYNVHQSLIAIGSGGVLGKGYLNGTQTKYKFVPEQSTDFIFCTIGEEFGIIGTSIVVLLLVMLMVRMIIIAERQKFLYNRIYAYGIVSVFLFHFTINIAMVLGLFPVIGIPLPFISYGGSSMLAFTIMLFILLKLDADNSSY